MADVIGPGYAERVLLRSLALSSYRNYAALKLDLPGRHVVLTGHNGAGKTNLLEAISFLSPGRGLRRTAYQDVTSVGPVVCGAAGFAVHVRLECAAYGEASIGTGVAGAGPDESGRRIRINGMSQPADRMLEYCRIIWLVPAMDGLFPGPASERRRFLDRMVLAIDPLHGRRVLDYEKAMRARNRLLAEGARDAAWLDALEAQMSGLGTAIAAARHEMVRLLGAVTERMLRRSCFRRYFPESALVLEGSVEKALVVLPAVDVEENFRRLLGEGRLADRAAGRTLKGPHRTDLGVAHREKSMPAVLCSTGEQKALLTGLVLSHAHLTGELSGIKPILLLDEIAAHLDSQRRQALFDLLDDLGAQTFMTGTDQALFRDLEGRAAFFSVQDGCISPVTGG